MAKRLSAALALSLGMGCPQARAPSDAADHTAREIARDGGADPQALYALGALLGSNVRDMDLTPAEVDAVKAGLGDQAAGAALKVDMAVFGPRAQQLGLERRRASMREGAAEQRKKDAAFVEAANQEPGVQKLEGGVLLRSLVEGSGPSPVPGDWIRVTFEGRLTDQKVFDTTQNVGPDGETLPLNSTIPCWGTALSRMKVGETAQLVCPPETAYGDTGRRPAIPGGATVVYRLRLEELNPPGPERRPRHGPGPRSEPKKE